MLEWKQKYNFCVWHLQSVQFKGNISQQKQQQQQQQQLSGLSPVQ